MAFVESEVMVEVSGVEHKISVDHYRSCPTCESCPTCKGRRVIQEDHIVRTSHWWSGKNEFRTNLEGLEETILIDEDFYMTIDLINDPILRVWVFDHEGEGDWHGVELLEYEI